MSPDRNRGMSPARNSPDNVPGSLPVNMAGSSADNLPETLVHSLQESLPESLGVNRADNPPGNRGECVPGAGVDSGEDELTSYPAMTCASLERSSSFYEFAESVRNQGEKEGAWPDRGRLQRRCVHRFQTGRKESGGGFAAAPARFCSSILALPRHHDLLTARG